MFSKALDDRAWKRQNGGALLRDGRGHLPSEAV